MLIVTVWAKGYNPVVYGPFDDIQQAELWASYTVGKKWEWKISNVYSVSPGEIEHVKKLHTQANERLDREDSVA